MDVVNPAVRDAEMLTANLAVRLPLAITQSNVLVYSALKFDPLLYSIRFFAGLIPGDDSRFAIFVWYIKLYSRLDSGECYIDFSRRLPPNYHKKWLLTKKR